ncbi:MAG: iron ABC transporter permease [Oligoflexia bacterium]|nr:iron ABC transporter permease [Oligoflexia bacterium]
MSFFIKKHLTIIFICLLVFIFSLKLGTIKISWQDLFLWLTNSPTLNVETVLSKIRLPRAFAALFVGGGLALSGAVLQSVLKNPLADSYTLGISGGSAVGASVVLFFSLTPQIFWVPVLSNLGAFFVLALVLWLSHKSIQLQSRSLILVGIMLSLFFGALSVFMVSLLPADKAQSALMWLLGEFGSPRDSWTGLLFLITLPIVVLVFLKEKVLDALSLGEVKALSFGFKPKNEKMILVTLSTVLTSLAITLSGLVGFIGLVAPHIARRFLKTSKHLHILFSSSLIGASLLLGADTLGRILIEDKEIPAGSLSALIGAPVLIYLLVRRSNVKAE